MKLLAPLGILSVTALALPADTQTRQVVTGPVAEYWVSASTTTGMGGMAGMMGGGGRPSMAAISELMRNGPPDPNAASHRLTLQLGSSRTAADPKADHSPPSGFGAPGDLPLLTPPKQAAPPPSEGSHDSVESYRQQQPKGRMLIFWGCGEHAGAGQPYVLDFATMAADPQAMSKFAAVMQGLQVTPETPPSPTHNATYGEWPNARSSAPTNPLTLVGDHSVRGDYSPDIHFALPPDHDFMGGISFLTNAKTPSGAVDLKWGPVSGAQGYLITVMGSGGDNTIVMWSSSETRTAAFAAPQYLSNGDIRRFVEGRQLLDAQATACMVPQEVAQAARQGLLSMTAYGGEVNFSDPPRPTNPRTPWNIAWTTKVRYRSSTSALLGQPMRGPPGRQAGAPGAPPPPPNPNDRVKSVLRGLGGLIPHP